MNLLICFVVAGFVWWLCITRGDGFCGGGCCMFGFGGFGVGGWFAGFAVWP